MERHIVVLLEHSHGRPNPVTYELVSCAYLLSKLHPAKVVAVGLGTGAETAARVLSGRTGLDVQVVAPDGLDPSDSRHSVELLSSLLPQLAPTCVCIAHTALGLDLAPPLSVRLQASCITAVQDVSEEDGKVLFSRSVQGGRFTSLVTSNTGTTVVTVQPGRFAPPEHRPEEPGRVELRMAEAGPGPSRRIGLKSTAASHAALEQADVIVSAGRGIGGPENLHLIRRLAACFPRSAVGGSRLVCDMGWLGHDAQVGLTGATVAPKLYFACGISGAPQHLAGMSRSGFVVAVNTDAGAPIFSAANVGVVEDILTFIPAFVSAQKKAGE